MIYRHGSGHFRDDNFGNVMEHFYDSTGVTILILSENRHGCTCMTKNATYYDKHVSSRKCFFVVPEFVLDKVLDFVIITVKNIKVAIDKTEHKRYCNA